MSLINDALKRAQEDKQRTIQTPSSAPSEEPAMEVYSAPRPRNKNRLVAILLVGVLAAAGGWYFMQLKKNSPARASANSNLVPIAQPAIAKIVPNMPATQPVVTQVATTQPAVVAETRTRIRVVAPPLGGMDVKTPTTQKAPPSQGTLDTATAVGKPDVLPGPLSNLMIPFTGPLGTPPPASVEIGPFGLPHSTGPTTAPATGIIPDKHGETPTADKPPAAVAKNNPATQPAPKPERTIAAAASIASQFHVSCIMFSDQGSTAIINGSPVKIGQTIRADGVPKEGLPEEAVVKKIERNCVEIELSGEKYLLRI